RSLQISLYFCQERSLHESVPASCCRAESGRCRRFPKTCGRARGYRPPLRFEHSVAPRGPYALPLQKRRIPCSRRDGCLSKAPCRRDRSDDWPRRRRPQPLSRAREGRASFYGCREFSRDRLRQHRQTFVSRLRSRTVAAKNSAPPALPSKLGALILEARSHFHQRCPRCHHFEEPRRPMSNRRAEKLPRPFQFRREWLARAQRFVPSLADSSE